MESTNRTLVMSPPELWELLDSPERMQGLMSSLLGHAAEVEVFKREPEARLGWKAKREPKKLLGWRAHKDEDRAWIEIALAEKGFGTNVQVSAENGADGTRLEGWLEAVLDELATPDKRPFDGVV